MINNRQQSGRRRGRGGQRQNGGNGRSPDMGNRIDNRARGNAAQLLEKYKTLARDAQQSGDRVLAEYYFQFADHYFRVLSETRARYEESNPNRPRQDYAEGDAGYDGDEDGGDDDDFDAPQVIRQQPQQRAPREDRPPQRDERPQQRDDRPQREGRPQRYERQPQQAETPAPVWSRDDVREEDGAEPVEQASARGRERTLRAHGNGASANGGDRGGEDRGGAAPARLDAGILPPSIAAGVPAAEASDDQAAPAPRRRGRPRKVVAEAPAEG